MNGWPRQEGTGSLTSGERTLVRLAAALGAAGAGARGVVLRSALEAAAEEALPEQVEELLLQSYLFLGYPAALNGFAVWREVSGRPAPEGARDDPAAWRSLGEEVCRAVYGGHYDRLREHVGELHPDLARWMVSEGYGKVLGRPGLGLATRELCIVALLAVLDAPVQLHSHLRGAVNVGAASEAVEACLAVAAEVSGPDARRRAAETWARVRARLGIDPESPGGPT
jgi:4-carboxymuconolactone decarboxylase